MPDQPPEQSYDRFTLPGDIPDETPASGYTASHPAGRGWIPGSRDLGLPGESGHEAHPRHIVIEHMFPDGPQDDPVAAIGVGQVFTPALQVRFLDHLATTGNARGSALRAGVSHETVYRLRRREPRFAALWRAALVHARSRVASELGDRALDGVLEEVWFRGELVGHRRRYDGRLLLAHLARLDRLVKGDDAHAPDAAESAEWFDHGLAALAGHAAPEGFDRAAGLWDERDPDAPPAPGPAGRPPLRDEYVALCASEAIEGVPRRREAAVFAAAQEAAGAVYDAWEAGALARLDAVLAGVGVSSPASPSSSEHPSPSSDPSSSSPRTRGTPGTTGPSSVSDGEEGSGPPAVAGATNEAAAFARVANEGGEPVGGESVGEVPTAEAPLETPADPPIEYKSLRAPPGRVPLDTVTRVNTPGASPQWRPRQSSRSARTSASIVNPAALALSATASPSPSSSK